MIENIIHNRWFRALRSRIDQTAERVIYVQSTILLAIVYWFFVLYMLAVKHTIHQKSGWQAWQAHADSLDDLKKEW